MTGNHKKIMDILARSEEPVTAATLSAQTGFSVRTVKKYISEINGENGEAVKATSRGYLVRKQKARLPEEEENDCPQTSEDRVMYVIKAMLQESDDQEEFNIYDFSEKLYVSYATVRRVLNSVKTICKTYGLELYVRGDNFRLEGSERNKRRMMSGFYYQEFEKNDLSLSAIQKVFTGYDIEWLKNVVINLCNKHHYYVNGYALINLILDIVISLDRIRKKCSQEKEEPYGQIMVDMREKILAKEIIAEFEQKYQVEYNGLELQSFTLLLISHLLKVDYKKIDYTNLDQIIGRECRELVDEILASTREYFLLNMENKEFYIRFALHIRNLLLRAKTHFINKNPLTETIKAGCPLLFDCAVSVTNVIQSRTGHEIVEDEIAYIALHIGTLLELNENSANKLKCVLLFPQYYDFASKLEYNLQNRFGNVMEIVNVITNQEDLMNEPGADLVISTVPVNLYTYDRAVVINSFLMDRDYDIISRRIDEVKKRKKKEKLLEQMIAVSNPGLFHKNVLFDSKEDIIHFMMQDMIALGYADAGYEKGVMEREGMSSTAFDCVAVPHSMEMNAIKTGMYIMLYDRPVPWGRKLVNVILLFAINRNDLEVFRSVFDNLVVLLMDRRTLNKVIQSRTYQEFIETVISCYE